MSVKVLSEQLRTLRLATAAGELEEALAKAKKAVSLNWFIELLQRELDARREKALKNRIRAARFAETTSLESFDWKFNPKINREKIEELAELEFVKRNGIALFLGNPGTGKTHLAIAIGMKAVRSGLRVYSTSVKRLSQEIQLTKLKGTLDLLFKKILSANLVILDDWGVVSMNHETAEEVFDLLDRRKHTSALLLTSNRDVDEWGEVFPDGVLASATIDRIFDRAEVVTFEGPSYRLKGKIKPAGEKKSKA